MFSQIPYNFMNFPLQVHNSPIGSPYKTLFSTTVGKFPYVWEHCKEEKRFQQIIVRFKSLKDHVTVYKNRKNELESGFNKETSGYTFSCSINQQFPLLKAGRISRSANSFYLRSFSHTDNNSCLSIL